MANRLFKQNIGTLENRLVLVAGTVAIGSDGYMTSDSLKGASVQLTGVGTYTVTLEDPFVDLLAYSFTFGAATAVNLVCQKVSDDVTTAKTVVFKTLAGATATTPSAACEVSIILWLKNSGV